MIFPGVSPPFASRIRVRLILSQPKAEVNSFGAIYRLRGEVCQKIYGGESPKSAKLHSHGVSKPRHVLHTGRSGDTINTTVTTQRPKDAVCAQVYGFFEQNVALGSDLTSGDSYTINANDETTSFVMQ